MDKASRFGASVSTTMRHWNLDMVSRLGSRYRILDAASMFGASVGTTIRHRALDMVSSIGASVSMRCGSKALVSAMSRFPRLALTIGSVRNLEAACCVEPWVLWKASVMSERAHAWRA